MANTYKDPTTGKFAVNPNGTGTSTTIRKPHVTPIHRDISEGFSGMVLQAMNVLINPDLAYRTDRTLSQQMIRDPMVMAPLQKRMLATAQMEWEVLPEDDTDKKQVEMAAELQSTIQAMPRIVDFFRDCLWGIWRGLGASELNWDFDQQRRRWWASNHRPHNGDKFTYDLKGNPRLLTKHNQTAGRELSQGEQERLILHRYDPDDGYFFEGAEAGYLFKGRGLRDLIWQYWWLKHNALKFWLDFIERFGGGMVLGRFPMHNPEAKQAIESVLENLISDSRVSVPVPQGMDAQGQASYGIEVPQLGGNNKAASELFEQFVERWAGKHIRFMILGQEFGYEDTGDGLGSSRADRLQDTFRSFRDYDATMLADSITDQYLARLVRFNFGNVPFKFRFQFLLEKDEYEQAEKRVKAAKEMGLSIPKEWAYKTLGIPQPKKDDEVLEFNIEEPAIGGNGFGGRLGALGAFSDYRPAYKPEWGPEIQKELAEKYRAEIERNAP